MTRQEWSLVLGVGICAGWLTGCTAPPQHRPREQLVAAVQPDGPALPPAATDAAPPKAQRDIQQAVVHPAPPVVQNQPAATSPAQNQPSPAPPAPTILPTEPPVLAALRFLLENRSTEAISLLVKFDRPTQDLLLCLLPLVARLAGGGLETASPQQIAHLMDQLDSALVALRQRSPVVLERLCYCRNVDSFGVYEPISDERSFRPGEVLLLYVELKNFSIVREGTVWQLRTQSTLEIGDGSGQSRPVRFVGNPDPGRSRSPRNDHYHSYRFCIPEDLRPGHYTLQLTVTDQPTQRTARRSLNLHVTTRPARP